jgi:hypothetical protein
LTAVVARMAHRAAPHRFAALDKVWGAGEDRATRA